MSITTITTKEQFDQVISTGKVLLKFTASWCGPCKQMKPIDEQIDSERDNLTVVYADVDELGHVARPYGVRGVPTYMVFENGTKNEGIKVGATTKSELESFIGK